MADDQGTRDRPRRSDGEQTHAAILDTAVQLASREGLGSLTIGRLAEAVGVSRSGLYAHFGSKQRLMLDIIEAARDIFDREVIQPGLAAPAGLAQLERVAEAYLSYIERRVFPGGCFFAGMLAEFDGQPGVVHDEVVADQREWHELLEGMATDAQRRGELDPTADVEQLAYEITAATQLANYYYILFGDPVVIERGRVSIRSTIERATRSTRATSARTSTDRPG